MNVRVHPLACLLATGAWYSLDSYISFTICRLPTTYSKFISIYWRCAKRDILRSLPKYGVIKTKTTLLHRFLLPNHFHTDYTGKSHGYDCTTKTFGTLLFSHRLTNKTRRYKKYFPIDLLWNVICFKETPMYFFPSNFSLFMLHSLIW